MYAVKLGVLLLALMPVLCQENHNVCNEVPKQDISSLNVTEQSRMLEVILNDLTCDTTKNETKPIKQQKLLQDTYCWGMTMMSKVNHESKLEGVYSSFLNRTANLYMESNDNIFVDLEHNCESNWPRYIALIILVLVLSFVVFCLHRMNTSGNPNPYQRMDNPNRRSELVSWDDGMAVVDIEPAGPQIFESNLPSGHELGELKPVSCMPSEATESDPKPKEVPCATNQILVSVDVHDSSN